MNYMKAVCFICSLIGFSWGATAQISGPNQGGSDMLFTINLSSTSGASPDLRLAGNAEYNRLIYDGFDHVFTTNLLQIDVSMTSLPLESWILEKQSDGSVTPVVQLTNMLGSSDDGYYLFQSLILTTNQIHSLLATNWYMAMDFGETSFIGSFIPQYNLANGPTAVIQSSLFGILRNPGFMHLVIATNNHSAKIIVDASQSLDPFYLPMQYEWTAQSIVETPNAIIITNTGIVVTNTLRVGTYFINLQVRDEILAGLWSEAIFQIATPGQITRAICFDIQNSSAPSIPKKVLIKILSAAADQFDHGHSASGCEDLRLFRRQLKVYPYDFDDNLYNLQRVQAILKAF